MVYGMHNSLRYSSRVQSTTDYGYNPCTHFLGTVGSISILRNINDAHQHTLAISDLQKIQKSLEDDLLFIPTGLCFS